jgi:hypothetical protein
MLTSKCNRGRAWKPLAPDDKTRSERGDVPRGTFLANLQPDEQSKARALEPDESRRSDDGSAAPACRFERSHHELVDHPSAVGGRYTAGF